MNADLANLRRKILDHKRLLIVAVFISILMWGCLENYGRLKRDAEIKTAFVTGQLPSDFKYSYYGRRNQPYAIMGLKPDWTLRSRMWRSVDYDQEELKYMAKWVWEDIGYARGGPYGAEILDPEFVKIGIIYTASWMATVKVDKDTKTVEVMPAVYNGGPSR